MCTINTVVQLEYCPKIRGENLVVFSAKCVQHIMEGPCIMLLNTGGMSVPETMFV